MMESAAQKSSESIEIPRANAPRMVHSILLRHVSQVAPVRDVEKGHSSAEGKDNDSCKHSADVRTQRRDEKILVDHHPSTKQGTNGATVVKGKGSKRPKGIAGSLIRGS